MIWLTTRCWRARRRPAGSLCCTGVRTWEGGGEAAAGCLLAWEQVVWQLHPTPASALLGCARPRPPVSSKASHHVHGVAAVHGAIGSLVNHEQHLGAARPGGEWRQRSSHRTLQPKRLVATSAAAQQPLLQSRWRDPHMQACGRQQLNAHLHAALRSDGHHQAASGGQLIHQVLRQAGRGGAHLCAARSSWQTGWGACQHHYANADAELMAADRCT